MIGKKTTLKTIKQLLKEYKVPVVVDTEFFQGKTHRWGIAWSYDSHVTRPPPVKRQKPYTIVLSNSLQQEVLSLRRLYDKLEVIDQPQHSIACTIYHHTVLWQHRADARPTQAQGQV